MNIMKNTHLLNLGRLAMAAFLFPGIVRTEPATSAAGAYVAHEWGTFTSVQGADGVQFDWNPFQRWDLPGFVYDRGRPDLRTNTASALQLLLAKSQTIGRQRMETPVIYFYSDRPLQVNVDVAFPEGTLTEWYPQASDFGPAPTPSRKEPSSPGKRSFLRWNDVAIRAADPIDKDQPVPPHDGSSNHYFAARATDASLLRVPGLGPNGPIIEHEKFLFYRGVGRFSAPLRVAMNAAEDKLILENTGRDTLAHLALVEIRQGRGRYRLLGELPEGKKKTVLFRSSEMKPLETWRNRFARKFEQALAQAGLYPKEAAAMMETWRDSWLGEDGLRVLYLLPRSWTDATLPLTLDPAPRELERVMVGRAEVLTPSMEWEFLRQTVRFSDADTPAEQEQARRAVQAMGLGRFAHPLAHRVLGTHPQSEFKQAAQALIQSIPSKEVTEPPPRL